MNLKFEVYNNLTNITLPFDLTAKDLQELLTDGGDSKNGDVSLPCFLLAKTLRTSPVQIAKELADSIWEQSNHAFEKVVALNGYVNFYFPKQQVVNNVLQEVLTKGKEFGKTDLGKGKKVFIDFSSVNLAKYMHIGHLKTTMLGWSLYKILTFLGYEVTRINYVGDYGTPFGKMIAAYKHWGNKKDIDARGVDAIQDLYVRFNQEAHDNQELQDEAREWFYKIENKDPEALEIFNWFTQIGREEATRICTILGVSFDDERGENYYSDKMDAVIADLEQKQLTQESQGATIVDLQEYNLGVALIKKSDGTSLYTTRDLATVEDRYKLYNFDQGLYVTSVQQNLHFAQLFKLVELLDKPYKNTLEHINYGTYSMPTGKIGSRFGKQAIIRDILNAASSQALQVLEARGTKHEDMDEVVRKIGVGALIFEVVKTERLKDSVFDLEKAVNFEGETSPYLQYTYARCCSIMEKVKQQNPQNIVANESVSEDTFELVKLLNKFPDVLISSHNDRETYYITRQLLSIASVFNRFYGSHRIIDQDQTLNQDNLNIVKAVQTVLATGLELLGIPLIEKM